MCILSKQLGSQKDDMERNDEVSLMEPNSSATRSACSRSPNEGSDNCKAVRGDDNDCEKYMNFFDKLPSSHQLLILSISMFMFFGMHNVLQEAIMKIPGFTHGVMLGYMEVLGVTIFSYLERRYIALEKGHVAPMSSYPLLTICLLASSALSNMSLNYINFPTKVVFRSCKLIPAMIIATIINKRIFSSAEYMSAIAISIGLIMFAAADWKLTPTFNSIGLVLVSLSVVADAILPNAQEKLFRAGASRLEVTFYTNIFTLIAMTISTILSGDLIGVIKLAMSDTQLQLYMVVYTSIAYIAISTYMNIVKRFGGVAAVLLATARKAMTLVLSFLIFPKEFSWYYVSGAILVLGGLLTASMIKQRASKSKKNQNLRSGNEKLVGIEAAKEDVKDLEMGSSTK